MLLQEKSGKIISYIIRKICSSRWKTKHLKRKLKTCCTRADAKYGTICIELWIERGLYKVEKKGKQQFTIIKDDSTDGHGGYGMGSISLENMSSVIIDTTNEKAYVDMDAMHARSKIERRVKYFSDKEEVPEGLLY